MPGRGSRRPSPSTLPPKDLRARQDPLSGFSPPWASGRKFFSGLLRVSSGLFWTNVKSEDPPGYPPPRTSPPPGRDPFRKGEELHRPPEDFFFQFTKLLHEQFTDGRMQNRFQFFRSPCEEKILFPRAFLSRVPSSRKTSGNASRTRSNDGVPGRTTSRASWSEWITGVPAASKKRATWDFPEAIPPVNPITLIRSDRGERVFLTSPWWRQRQKQTGTSPPCGENIAVRIRLRSRGSGLR